MIARLDVEEGRGLEPVLDLLAPLEQDVDPVAAGHQRQRGDLALDPRPELGVAARRSARDTSLSSVATGWPRLLRIVSRHSIIGSTSVTSTTIFAERPPTTTSAWPLARVVDRDRWIRLSPQPRLSRSVRSSRSSAAARSSARR